MSYRGSITGTGVKRALSRLVRHLTGRFGFLYAIVLIVLVRLFVVEVYVVRTPSMQPSIMPTEVFLVDKLSGGALVPRRFSDIPVLNVFTWARCLSDADERNDWGYRRLPGFRSFRKGDVILFHALDDSHHVLVKRIAYMVEDRGMTHYYVLGDNRGNSTDSRAFGLVPDSLVIGRATYVIYSWDGDGEGAGKFRWRRIGCNISGSSAPAR